MNAVLRNVNNKLSLRIKDNWGFFYSFKWTFRKNNFYPTLHRTVNLFADCVFTF